MQTNMKVRAQSEIFKILQSFYVPLLSSQELHGHILGARISKHIIQRRLRGPRYGTALRPANPNPNPKPFC